VLSQVDPAGLEERSSSRTARTASRRSRVVGSGRPAFPPCSPRCSSRRRLSPPP